MTLTIMPPFEEDEPVFPATEKYLFVGGPKHAEEVEIIAGDRVFRVFAKAEMTPFPNNNDLPLLGSGGMQVHNYVRQDLGFQDNGGQQYMQTVYVHEAVPNPEVAQRLLMAALLAQFVRRGRKVIQDVPDSRGPSGS